MNRLKNLLKYVPGFRSGKPLNMIIASIYYIFLIWSSIDLGFGNFLFFLSYPFFFCFFKDTWHSRSTIFEAINNSNKKVITQLILSFLLPCVMFFGGTSIHGGSTNDKTVSNINYAEATSEYVSTSTTASSKIIEKKITPKAKIPTAKPSEEIFAKDTTSNTSINTNKSAIPSQNTKTVPTPSTAKPIDTTDNITTKSTEVSKNIDSTQSPKPSEIIPASPNIEPSKAVVPSPSLEPEKSVEPIQSQKTEVVQAPEPSKAEPVQENKVTSLETKSLENENKDFKEADDPVGNENFEVSYIGNRKTRKFHYSHCSSVDEMNKSNVVEFGSRDEAVNSGYVPCKRCHP